mmetsp:Transcript_11374/g.39673  ORF Transcript_11374/g.39673 Transcript_11374/m.39673 type:complete len:392 (+) Transcript_11374:105-1280(+)
MGRERRRRQRACDDARIGAPPQVAHLHRVRRAPAQRRHRQRDVHGALVGLVEEDDGDVAVGERAAPSLSAVTVVEETIARCDQRVLVDGDHLRVRDDLPHLVAHVADVGADDERRRPQRPERVLRPRLFERHRDRKQRLEKVGVEPAVLVDPTARLDAGDVVDDVHRALPEPDAGAAAADVPEGQVVGLDAQLLRHLVAPRQHVVLPPLARVEQNRAAGGVDGVAEVAVELAHGLADAGPVAVVGLDEVHAPASDGGGVLSEVAEGARAAAVASLGAHTRIQAEQQPLAVHVVRQRLHAVGELRRLGHELPVGGAVRRRPTIVHDDVLVPELIQALRHHRVRDGADLRVRALVNQAAQVVRAPGVPSHRRQAPHAVVVRPRRHHRARREHH